MKIQVNSTTFASSSDGFHIKKLEITKKVNQHHECFVRFRFDKFSSDSELANKDLKIFDDNSNLIFSGKVYSSGIMYSSEKGSKEIEIKAYSLTKDTDVVHNNRIFQSPKKKMGDILNSVNQKFTVRGEDVKIVHPVVQYDETDFEFAVRMARENSVFVFVDDLLPYAALKLGKYLNDTSTIVDIDKVYSISKVHQFDCKDGDMKFPAGLIVKTEQYIPFGTTVNLNDTRMGTRINGNYVVFQMSCCREEQSAYFFEYVLYDKGSFPVTKLLKYNDDLHIRAKVKKNDDAQGRIQVEFSNKDERYDIFEDVDGKDENTRTWMPYLTPHSQKNSGIVFMPNIDDFVEVVFSRNAFFAINSLRLENIGEEFSDREENKYIFHKNRYIAFRDKGKKGIELFSEKKGSIYFNDKDEKGKITINIGKSTIEMDNDSIKISNGSSSIKVESNDIEISNNSSTILVKSGEINVNSQKINLK